ncbi:glutamate-1-semialdehyde 2,1-aminomutase [Fulvivirgaceae bacterium PWU4]|uniref:Glutamate-1-semialdehyde 2,1-aminomutase n=1 Tax=Chryseosolibacter histidini TaxID=2782349 RepID=A0AAP2DNY0_9BACT|nr:glutamate-1-semialdehyde 2,1-aminomutase [Chryseosolibacter histidini]MBT1698552.1 glutamate-1-semialdehyde 2,1-aminomutase [Chryseosolibacter histidini]
MNEISRSQALFDKAKQFIPGGVNSPVRAFRAVGGNPLFIKKAKGPYLYDEDGNQYIDLINSWGPMILGHAHPAIEEAIREAVSASPSFGAPTAREVEMAELICSMVPSVEKVRMVNSGTEATMSAIRVARGYTGRDKIIKMEGCYHGHGDSFLIAAGSGALTFGYPDSPGVTKGTAQDTLIAPFNDLKAIENLIAKNPEEIAALILEPVVGNMGCVIPAEGYLQGLRELCTRHGIILIFDEVMTGFRLAQGGAQELYGVKPDMSTLGKIIGGGLPVGAYGGRKEIMDSVSPAGPVYQAGTLSGNPMAMAAGLVMLKHLKAHPEIYGQLDKTTTKLVNDMGDEIRKAGFNFTINQVGSMFTLFFTATKVTDFGTAKTSDTALFAKYFQAMLQQGIYLAPSQYEAMFVSTAVDNNIADKILTAHRQALKSF